MDVQKLLTGYRSSQQQRAEEIRIDVRKNCEMIGEFFNIPREIMPLGEYNNHVRDPSEIIEQIQVDERLGGRIPNPHDGQGQFNLGLLEYIARQDLFGEADRPNIRPIRGWRSKAAFPIPCALFGNFWHYAGLFVFNSWDENMSKADRKQWKLRWRRPVEIKYRSHGMEKVKAPTGQADYYNVINQF